MSIGLSAYDLPVGELLHLAAAADDAGFDAIWLGEHVVLPVGYASAHPTDRQHEHAHVNGPIINPATELVDPLVALAAAAGATRGLRLATGIYLLPLRHPLVTARAAVTLQEASGGRFLLGVGAGWLEEEFAALGIPFASRHRRLEESVEILRAAWAGGRFEHHGPAFSHGPVQVTRQPVDVPLIMGGNTPPALRRAARLGDGWFSSGTPDLHEAVRLRATLLDLRAAADLGPFRCYFRVPSSEDEVVARYAEAGIDDIVIWADQVWPVAEPLDARRQRLFQTAARLGLTRRR